MINYMPPQQVFRLKDVQFDATLRSTGIKSGFDAGTSGFIQQVDKKELIIRGEVSPNWFLVKPIKVQIERGDHGEFVLSNMALDVYGVGTTIQEAQNDLISMLIDSFEDLLESENELSTYLKALLNKLRLILKPI